MKKLPQCPLCGEWFRTSQGVRGHLNFKHGMARRTQKMIAHSEAIMRKWRPTVSEVLSSPISKSESEFDTVKELDEDESKGMRGFDFESR